MWPTEKKEAVLAKIKQKESSLLAEIKSNQIKRQALKAKIAEAIKRELAEIERTQRSRTQREERRTREPTYRALPMNLQKGKIISKNFEKK